MGGTGVIDHFLEVFTRYIDSGFGLLGGEVAFIATTLIVIDITLAALFWSWGADEDIIARLVKKTLFVGVFAYHHRQLEQSRPDRLRELRRSRPEGRRHRVLRRRSSAARPRRAGRPRRRPSRSSSSISGLMGYISFFENFVQIVVLLFAWVMVLLAFFILAIQLFVTLIEFKLTTLAGFVLIPFGLFGKTAFLAERVLGNVVSSGVKVLVLAVIVGIGSTLFAQFTQRFRRQSADDRRCDGDRARRAFAARPRHLRARHRQRPDLRRTAAWRRRAVGTGLAAGGAVMAGGAAAGMAARGAGAALGATAAAARGGAAIAGGAATSYGIASAGQSGMAGVASGLGGVARAGAGAAAQSVKRAAGSAGETMAESYRGGARTAVAATGGTSTMGTIGGSAASEEAPATSSPPAWAQRMKRHQTISHGATAAAHAVKSGDSHGGGASVSLRQDDR